MFLLGFVLPIILFALSYARIRYISIGYLLFFFLLFVVPPGGKSCTFFSRSVLFGYLYSAHSFSSPYCFNW